MFDKVLGIKCPSSGMGKKQIQPKQGVFNLFYLSTRGDQMPGMGVGVEGETECPCPGPAPGRRWLPVPASAYPLGPIQVPLGVCVPPFDNPWPQLKNCDFVYSVM